MADAAQFRPLFCEHAFQARPLVRVGLVLEELQVALDIRARDELLHRQIRTRLKADGSRLPAIVITGNGDVPTAVGALRAGASDFIDKPIGEPELLASIDRALERGLSGQPSARVGAPTRLAGLTARQRRVLDLVLAGKSSKLIAADLGISQRTVEAHRAAIMKKTGSRSLSELIRMGVAATWEPAPLDQGQ